MHLRLFRHSHRNLAFLDLDNLLFLLLSAFLLDNLLLELLLHIVECRQHLIERDQLVHLLLGRQGSFPFSVPNQPRELRNVASVLLHRADSTGPLELREDNQRGFPSGCTSFLHSSPPMLPVFSLGWRRDLTSHSIIST